MELITTCAERNLLVRCVGELDHHGAKGAMVALDQAVEAALPKKLVLDFEGVSFMDSSGIAFILRALQKMQRLEGHLLVCNVKPQAKRVLDAAGVSRMVRISQEKMD
ncbi:anti-sigma factor antagonist [Bengtsoniella intestinalis]|uniref:anti-sigma factor antagonist n=1 Tax=Bengtsoniella intestinalis TaxID=3073143 RepID=UPI00391FBCFD